MSSNWALNSSKITPLNGGFACFSAELDKDAGSSAITTITHTGLQKTEEENKIPSSVKGSELPCPGVLRQQLCQEIWSGQTFFNKLTEETEEICDEFILGNRFSSDSGSAYLLNKTESVVQNFPTTNENLVQANTNLHTKCTEAKPVELRRIRTELFRVAHKGEAALDSKQKSTLDLSFRQAQRLANSAYLCTLAGRQSPNPLPNFVLNGGSRCGNSSNVSESIPYRYVPPAGGCSDFALARLPVGEQFETLLRAHGYGCLPKDFHYTFWRRLPHATRVYLRHVDIVFGGFIKSSGQPEREAGASPGRAKSPNKSDVHSTGHESELGTLSDAAAASSLCLAHHCFLAGAKTVSAKTLSSGSDYYANWVVKSEVMGLENPVKCARDLLLMLFVIRPDGRYAPLDQWKSTIAKCMSNETIQEVEKMCIADIDNDAERGGGKLGRLRMYDQPDCGIDAHICNKYLDYFNKHTRESILKDYRQYEMTVVERRSLVQHNVLPGPDRKAQLVRRVVFEVRSVLADRAATENTLLHRMQPPAPREEDLHNALLSLTKSSPNGTRGERVSVGNVRCQGICNNEFQTLAEAFTARGERCTSKDHEDAGELEDRLNDLGNSVRHASTRGPILPRSSVATLINQLSDSETRAANLKTISKTVYLLGNLHLSLSYSAKKIEVRDAVLDYFIHFGIGTQDKILAYIMERVPDIDSERHGLLYFDLRKIISEFADCHSGSFIFIGLTSC